MKKVIGIFSLFLWVFVLGGCSYKIVKTDEARPTQPTNALEVQQNIDLNNTNGNSDAETKCLADAKKVFDTFKPLMGIDTYSYKSHYNDNGTCYVLVHGFGESGQQDALLNAPENKSIAQCDSYSKVSKMNFCNYSGTNEKYDITKFNDFIKQYMNE